jgi:hypothetical protein
MVRGPSRHQRVAVETDYQVCGWHSIGLKNLLPGYVYWLSGGPKNPKPKTSESCDINSLLPPNPQRVENSWEGCESNESYLYQLNPSICFLPVRTEGLDSRPPQPSPHTQGGNLLLQSPSNVRSRSWSLNSLSLQNLALVLLLPLSDTFGSHIYIGCIYP